MLARRPLSFAAAAGLAGLLALVTAPAAGAATTTIAQLQSLINAAPDGGTVTLDADIPSTTTGALVIVGKSVTIDLAGHSLTLAPETLNTSGIHVYDGATLIIESTQPGGVLTATGTADAAGIGNGFGEAVGAIVIDSGTVIANGGDDGAGIGGGHGASGGTVSISGGVVHATGGRGGAGIGGGGVSGSAYGNGGTVTISAGAVTATGGSGAAGIGGGYGGHGGSTTISGGDVEANGGSSGAGIGGGVGGPAHLITVSGGLVAATGGTSAAGIGSGHHGGFSVGSTTGDAITLTGGTVRAVGGSDGAGIGGGLLADPGSIIIDGATVNASSTEDAAAIGGGFLAGAGTISILSGTVTAQGGPSGAGIGTGRHGAGGTVTIEGGSVNATGGSSAAGIGTSGDTTSLVITIAGGYVTAQGGASGAGIGGAWVGQGPALTLSGGRIVATGGTNAPGIGSGSSTLAETAGWIRIDGPASMASLPANGGGTAPPAAAVSLGTPVTGVGAVGTASATVPGHFELVFTYEVTYVWGNGDEPTVHTVEYGDPSSSPGTPPRTGYTFAGWTSDPADAQFTDPVVSPVTFTAQWTPIPYDVTFVYGNGDPDSVIPTDFGTAVAAPSDPTRPGWTFVGWESDTGISIGDPIEQATVFTAQWTFDGYAPQAADISGLAASCLSIPDTAYAGDDIDVTVCPFDGDADLWFMSTPVALASAVALSPTDGTAVILTIPADAETGAHHVVAYDPANGTVLGYAPIEILAEPEPELAATGAESTSLIAIAAGLAALGVLFVTRRRV